MKHIWNGFSLGEFRLNHRLALAPMTRLRALDNGVPSDLAIEYYKQRASLGFLITEGTQPSRIGQGYVHSPGIYTEQHIEGWKKITDAVHAENAHIFIQLMHAGRASHPLLLDGDLPVAPSAIAAPQKIFTKHGPQDAPIPRALETEEIAQVQSEFVHAAQSAIKAGADGVEVHGANGYLPWQFLIGNANTRTDQYGGSIENKARFVLEVTQQIANSIGANKTGIRLSPNVNFSGLYEDADWKETYRYLLTELEKLSLAYVHVFYFGDEEFLVEIRQILKNTPLFLLRAGRDFESIERDLENNIADVFPIGTLAISNPDLVERLKTNKALTPANQEFFFSHEAQGYIDYPFERE